MPGKPDIILIAYHFPPDPAIGSARPYRFYRHLRKSGRRCWVVTAAKPGGAPLPDVVWVLDRTAGLWDSKTRLPLSVRVQTERFIRRFLVPAGLGIGWSLDAARQCRSIVKENPGRSFVAVSTFPPVGAHLAGLWLRLRGTTPWIADFRDPMISNDPEYLKWPLANPVSARLERFSLGKASGVIANTEQLAGQWREAYPWARQKVHTIWNGFDPDEQPAARPIPPRPYRVLAHAGALYGGRTPGPILESLSRLRETNPEVRDMRVVLVGPAECSAALDPGLCERGASEGWLDVRDRTVPKSEAQQLIEEADYLLLLQPQSAVQVPGKLFEYISVGRPIVAFVPQNSAVEDILGKAGVPYVCIHPDDMIEVRDRKLLEALRFSSAPVRFSDWYADRFNAGYQAGLLAALADGACGDGAGG
jgi:glycosyltransferase involved in cell wall biosynthesis